MFGFYACMSVCICIYLSACLSVCLFLSESFRSPVPVELSSEPAALMTQVVVRKAFEAALESGKTEDSPSSATSVTMGSLCESRG